MCTRGLRLGPAPGHEGAHDGAGNHGVGRRDGLAKHTVECAQRQGFGPVAIARGPFALEKLLQCGCQRRRPHRVRPARVHRHGCTSASVIVTRRRVVRSKGAYSMVVSADACPSTSPMRLSGLPAESATAAPFLEGRIHRERPPTALAAACDQHAPTDAAPRPKSGGAPGYGRDPRRTGQIRPLVDTANPAIFGVPRRGLSSTSWGRVRARMSGPWCASCAART